jgi:hypothetical protein
MKTNKANNRDKKRNRRKYGMRVSGRSVFLSVEIKIKKGKKAKNE